MPKKVLPLDTEHSSGQALYTSSIANRPPLVTYAHFFVSRSRHKSGYARLCIRRDAELQTFPLRESVRKFVHGTNDQRHNSAYSGMCNRLLPICMLAPSGLGSVSSSYRRRMLPLRQHLLRPLLPKSTAVDWAQSCLARFGFHRLTTNHRSNLYPYLFMLLTFFF